MAKYASTREDSTISGLKDAHISPAGVVSGLISTFRTIAAPVPSYGSIREGEHDDGDTLSSKKNPVAESQPAQLLETIHEDVEPETANEDKVLLDARGTKVADHPVLRRAKRIIQGSQEDDPDFSPLGEIEYMRRVKRVGIDKFPRELSDSRPDGSSHSGVDHTRFQPDLNNDMACQSSPATNQLGAGAAEEISLDGIFVV
ncbi:uncharacterized protein HD556DRAFT_1534949 [Suillus plorans]|uniref:Uncharacterized protein n=1 Tax=Suillus plorans TaxID=116603 RepID=A0A9P7IZY9_9AGAM|nr:uncharacterized protein HD556DRAFT_1534949 [Suillus plorans]KAG1798208.1 hypothetical protein HD556DRAFT_1534949 [Suillus plorans]